MKTLIDHHGRRIRKLRISLTDRCNLRCHYCMPVNASFMPSAQHLTSEEYREIVSELVEYGLEEIRLTGGEPLLRQDFSALANIFASLSVKKIGLTSNGIILDRFLAQLKDCRIHHLNISLDSLNAENFKRITRGDYGHKVISNIVQAKNAGFEVKLNVVAMRGINDHELFDFVDFSAAHQIEVRFLELMRIGYACSQQQSQFISAGELINQLKASYELLPISRPFDATSFNFKLDNGANIGFIASETQPFCGHCSRWRLSADGILRACLLKDEGLMIRHKTSGQRQILYQQLLGMKPMLRPKEVTHAMNAIGG